MTSQADILAQASRINELSELMGLLRFEIMLKFDKVVGLDDVSVKVRLSNDAGTAYPMPMDFKPVILCEGDTYSLRLPVSVSMDSAV